ncbi:MAG: hypothetical protein ACE5HF_03750 [Gemmatimonadota bacterium]
MTTWGIAAAAALSVTGADTISTGRDLIQAMHDRYADSWYETVRFEQTTTFFGADGSVARSETWQEFLHLPGRLRVELPGGRGLIFRNDSIYQLQDGAVANAAPQIHSLLVLGFDIYRQDPEATIARLEQAGFDLDRLRADRWNGRPVWVVGPRKGTSGRLSSGSTGNASCSCGSSRRPGRASRRSGSKNTSRWREAGSRPRSSSW